jgi:hypothetical protein
LSAEQGFEYKNMDTKKRARESALPPRDNNTRTGCASVGAAAGAVVDAARAVAVALGGAVQLRALEHNLAVLVPLARAGRPQIRPADDARAAILLLLARRPADAGARKKELAEAVLAAPGRPLSDTAYSRIMQAYATTAGGLAVGASDPAYMVFYKDTPFADAYAVAAAFATSQSIPLNQIQSVPEPTTLALVGSGTIVAAAAGLRRWMRRRIISQS